MRARLAPFFVILAAVGCSAARNPRTGDAYAGLPPGHFVAVPHLAETLQLAYLGEGEGFIELSAPPDNVMLVADSRRALVNGETIDLESPCQRRGDHYVLARADAARVQRALLRVRSTRVVPAPAPVVRPRPAPKVTGLPDAWRPKSAPRAWKWIVIHHQGAASGSAAAIHRAHLQRGWDGMGYHFVVGNGTGSRDGEVEVGYRWNSQLHGAHTRVRQDDDNYWNLNGIGICLVGDFSHQEPSRRQMDALVKLVRALRAEFGIAAKNVIPHRSVDETLCPGSSFPWDEFRARVR